MDSRAQGALQHSPSQLRIFALIDGRLYAFKNLFPLYDPAPDRFLHRKSCAISVRTGDRSHSKAIDFDAVSERFIPVLDRAPAP